jgi:acetyl esterase/lipase
MPQDDPRPEIARKKVVYERSGLSEVTVRRDEPYVGAGGAALTMDVYSPPGLERGARRPAVVFVIGFSDVGAQARLGCRFKEMESFVSWARLVAASGMVAITHSTGADPAADVRALLRHVRENAAELGVDASRVGLWACSGHAPSALAALMAEGDRPKCAALFYGYLLDLEGSSAVAEAARTFGFANPAAGRSVADLPHETPLFIARAGRDAMPRLNEATDRFVGAALAANRPLTLVNHPAAPHAFDLMDAGETSREVIRQALAFLSFQLRREPVGGVLS